MRDAFGGIVNIVIIVVFLVIVSGYLAFNVNYTKAFRVKNKIISTYEEYEGACDEESSECNQKIREYMEKVGYSANNFEIKEKDGGTTNSWKCFEIGYCSKKIVVSSKDGDAVKEGTEKEYYKIVTQININIPIINKIMPGLRIFEVSGDTKVIEKVG